MKILMIAPGNMGYGGVQNVIMQLIKELSSSHISFDVIVFDDEIGFYEKEIKEYGNVYRILVGKKHGGARGILEELHNENIIYREVLKIINEYGPYDVMHCQFLFEAAPCLAASRKAGIPIRIAHSHTEPTGHSSIGRKMITDIQRAVINRNATIKLGVTKGACDFLYGKNNDGIVIKNPVIDLNKFNTALYPEETNGLNLIHVGHFGPRKNELFSIEILKALKELDTNPHLTFIGFSGDHPDYLEQMKNRIKEYNLSDYVEFLPSDTNMPEALSKSLYMLIPSISEGLPIVALEAQAMGLHCFISDSVSQETDQGISTFLSLDKGAEYWADEILTFYKDNGNKKQYVDMSHYEHKKICDEYKAIYRGE